MDLEQRHIEIEFFIVNYLVQIENYKYFKQIQLNVMPSFLRITKFASSKQNVFILYPLIMFVCSKK